MKLITIAKQYVCLRKSNQHTEVNLKWNESNLWKLNLILTRKTTVFQAIILIDLQKIIQRALKKEEASFLSAYSYKLASPSFSLDPTDTNKALESFQSFINEYPDSDKLDEANKHYKELRYKLQKKYFEIAKTYYRTADYDLRNYKAAIQAFDNLLSDYLGSEFKEEALYFRLKAAHDFVLKSTYRRKPVRIKDAKEAYEKLVRNYPESKFMEDANKMLNTLNAENKESENLIAKQKEYQNSLKK